jgi:O-antigen ligase
MENTRMNQLAGVVICLFMIILSWCFTAAYSSYAFAVFILFFLGDAVYSHKRRYHFLPVVTKSFLYMAFGILALYFLFVLSAVIHGNHRDVFRALDHFALVIPFFMAWWISAKYEVEKGIGWGILGGLAIACAIGLYQWHLQPGLRIFSSYAHPNHFGTMINLMVPCIVYAGIRNKDKWYRVLSVIVVVAAIICLLMTRSRGALVALSASVILGLIITAFMMRKFISPLIKKISIIVAAVTIIFVGFGAYYMQNGRHEVELGGERGPMIVASIKMWEDHKIIGVGADHWEDSYYGKYHPENGREQGLSMPHNMALYYLSTGGILGGLGYLIYLVATVAGLYVAIKNRRDYYWCFTISIIFLSFFLQGMVDTTIINKIPSRMYFALMGIVAAQSQIDQVKKY